MKVKTNNKEEEPSNKLILMFMLVILIRKLRRLMSFLTQYFPFSLLPTRLYIHNKNREQNIAWDLVHHEAYRLGVSFDIVPETDDQHFIYLSGKLRNRKKGLIEEVTAKIQKTLGETNFYVKKIDEKRFIFMFAKGSVIEAERLGKIKLLL